MTLAMVIDLISGSLGHSLVLNEYIYNSFVIITLGSFGIAGIEKFASTSHSESNKKEEI